VDAARDDSSVCSRDATIGSETRALERRRETFAYIAAVSSDESERSTRKTATATRAVFFCFTRFHHKRRPLRPVFFSLLRGCSQSPENTRRLMPSPRIPHYSSTARARRAPRNSFTPRAGRAPHPKNASPTFLARRVSRESKVAQIHAPTRLCTSSSQEAPFCLAQ